jgi:hypothetical protein
MFSSSGFFSQSKGDNDTHGIEFAKHKTSCPPKYIGDLIELVISGLKFELLYKFKIIIIFLANGSLYTCN